MGRAASRNTTLALIGLLLLVQGPARSWGQDETGQDLDALGANPQGTTLHGKLHLSLQEAIAIGLENNLGLEVERHAPLIAFEDKRIAWGAYDPETFGDFGYTSDVQPNSSAFLGIDETQNYRVDGTVGIRGLIPYLGGKLALEFGGDRLSTNVPVSDFDPEYNSEVTLSWSLPLLRDLIWNEPWTQVKTSRIRYEVASEEFRTALMDTVRDFEAAYWNLVASDEARRVARKSHETALALLEQTRTQYEVGVVSKVEVTEAEAGAADREVNLIIVDNTYRLNQDTLIDLVLGPHLTAGSQLEIVPTDRPEDFVEQLIDVSVSVDRAFERRPELAAAKREVERREIELRFAKNQRLPSFDLEGAYAASGLAGDGTSRCRTDRVTMITTCGEDLGGFGSSLSNISQSEGGDRFAVRGVVSIPLGNYAPRHRVSRSVLELRRANTRLKRLQQEIVFEVRASARDLDSTRRAINAAERQRVASAEQLRAERIRLEHGESTPFEVLLREEDLVSAEITKINALRAYRNSVTALHRAEGTILSARNIVMDEASTLR